MPMKYEAIDVPTGSDAFAYSMEDAANPARMPVTIGKTDGMVHVIGAGDALLSQRDCQSCRMARSQLYPECLAFCEYVSGSSLTGYITSALQFLRGALYLGRSIEETITGGYVQIQFGSLDAEPPLPPDTFRTRADWGDAMDVKTRDAPATPARRLQTLSALDQGSLARIFGVSRQTYNTWALRGNTRGRSLEQLLQVLSFVQDAQKRLGSPAAVRDWLLTPVAPGEMKPVDLLVARDYETCRGLLLQLRTGRERIRPIGPSAKVVRGLKREEVDEARELVNPRAWIDDEW